MACPEVSDVEIKIKMDASEATASVTQYLMVLRSVLRLAQRMGLPDEQVKAIQAMQQLIRVAYQLRMAYLALAAAEATTTLGMIKAGIAVAGAVIILADVGA